MAFNTFKDMKLAPFSRAEQKKTETENRTAKPEKPNPKTS